jgi:hypothetical protein
MRELALLAMIVVAGIALFAACKGLERMSGRPGVAMGIGATAMFIVGVVSVRNGNPLLSGLFFLQGIIFGFEAWQRRRAPGSERA